MHPGHVAYGLHAQYGLQISPETVAAWERGAAAPRPHELSALAGVLWCSPGELLAQATTLREHRMSHGLAPGELARRVGVDASAYLKMEESGRWRGNARQTAALADVLRLGPRELLTVTGRDEDLANLLRDAVAARWQPYVRPVGKLLPLDKDLLEGVLERLHSDYQSRMVATLSWGDTTHDTAEPGRDFLDRIVDHFWELAEG
ncbi:helix-turn-helix domain-containing protein [Streptomyces sp. PR69]|uniref:helix-turn-helix domain-containing protein n=1 Tax=Streptomyces sp. PR69 TaxID=2984950 RepID=UPI002263D892|nr:helix-turn-helix transcriptional regulator [Streptomyces sp. PR69]